LTPKRHLPVRNTGRGVLSGGPLALWPRSGGLGPGSGARGAYQGGCVAHTGALGVLLRHDLRRRDAELDAPVLDARLVAGLRAAGRAVLDAAVGEAEHAAVPRAGDAVVGDRALAQGAAHVTAGRGD